MRDRSKRKTIKELMAQEFVRGAEQQLGDWVVFAFGRRFISHSLRHALELARQYNLRVNGCKTPQRPKI